MDFGRLSDAATAVLELMEKVCHNYHAHRTLLSLSGLAPLFFFSFLDFLIF